MSKAVATRDGFGKELVEIGKKNEKVIVVSADLEDATRAEYFKNEFPDRFFSVGIAEQDMVSMAAGLSLQGFIPFINSFAVFLTNRAYDQLRIDLCYNNCNVKIICSHAGVTVGPDGATAQCLEDLAIMRVLPNMVVVCPADVYQAKKATRLFAEKIGPMYMRTSRSPLPIISKEDDDFIIGKANTLRKGTDVTIIACGVMVSESLSASEILKKEGVEARVINMHTIKPIDQECIMAAAKETGAIVTAEEHQAIGGLGSAVSEVVVKNCAVPMEIIGVDGLFGQTGSPEELLKEYGLKDTNIVEAVKKVIKRKASSKKEVLQNAK